MKIALFTDTYTPNVNGVANTLARLVREAHRRGDEVALFTPQISSDPAACTALHLQSPGIPVPVYPELRLAFPNFSGANRALSGFAPDLIHLATESTMGLLGRRWALRRGVPIVTSFHTNYAEYARGYRMGVLEGGIWRYLRWFHAAGRLTFHPSQDTGELLRAMGFHPRCRLWSRGVDAEAFSPVHRREEMRREIAPDAETIVLFVGRIAPEKSCKVAIDAFAQVSAEFPNAVLVFVGDGPARAELEGLKVPGVHFVGYRRGKELAETYAAGDLLLFPSETETFGNVVLEGFASGLPAIVADRGGVRDTVIQGETGLRCTPGDSAAFAAALRRLLGDVALRNEMGARARTAALDRSWNSIFDGLFLNYREALDGAALKEESWTT
jgi:glycosyltransferase involved in cell wall biosynthesis